MAKSLGPKPESVETPPTDFAQTTPAQVYPSEYSFVLQCVMENQRALGALDSTVKSIDSEVKEQRKSIDSIKRYIWLAIGIFIGGGAVSGFFLDRGLDKIVDALKNAP